MRARSASADGFKGHCAGPRRPPVHTDEHASDFLGELQKDEPLYKVHLQINVPPLREAEAARGREPAGLNCSRRGSRPLGLWTSVTRRTVEDSIKDAGCLATALLRIVDDMWTRW